MKCILTGLKSLLQLTAGMAILVLWDSWHPIDTAMPSIGNAIDNAGALAGSLLSLFHFVILVIAALWIVAFVAFGLLRRLRK
jgi:hypothetical protein